jgi:protein required for attachment to host cells
MARRFKFTEDDLQAFKESTETSLEIATNDKDYDRLELLLARRRKLIALMPGKAEPKKPRKSRTSAKQEPARDGEDAATVKQRLYQLKDKVRLTDEALDDEIAKATGNEFQTFSSLVLRAKPVQLAAVQRHLMNFVQ